MLPAAFPALARVRLFDRHPKRARGVPSPLPVTVAATAAEAVQGAEVVVTVTNTVDTSGPSPRHSINARSSSRT
ncbi:hypothetical protein GZL_02742 [Streptomyces sp. 769]|nr:hypothetical protein GZL_02742 [Streptomyces sp. 769]